jgi:drug/metabolite transporter (DMT)-like permease
LDAIAFTAVLLGAAMHASWNVIVKVGLDRFLAMTLISTGAAVFSLIVAPFVPWPKPEAWPFLVASVLIHIGYKAGLIGGYKAGDLGQVYPIARGTAPFLVALAGIVLLPERLSPMGLAGILALASGVSLMALRGGRDLARFNGRAIAYALLTALCIAAYTLVDGIGSRVNGSPHSYAVWFFILDAIPFLAWALWRRGGEAAEKMLAHWRSGLGGGLLILGSYWIALWAMATAPIAIVAALRETSVLFAAALAVLWLGEPLYRVRVIAAVVIVIGVVLVRLS